MVVLIRDTGNIIFHTSTIQIITSNMASKLNINMANRYSVDNIIFSNSSRRKQVRDHSLTSSNSKNRSNTSLIELDLEDKAYHNKIQYNSDNIVKDKPVIILDSPQLEYATPPSRIHSISKTANTNHNMR